VINDLRLLLRSNACEYQSLADQVVHRLDSALRPQLLKGGASDGDVTLGDNTTHVRAVKALRDGVRPKLECVWTDREIHDRVRGVAGFVVEINDGDLRLHVHLQLTANMDSRERVVAGDDTDIDVRLVHLLQHLDRLGLDLVLEQRESLELQIALDVLALLDAASKTRNLFSHHIVCFLAVFDLPHRKSNAVVPLRRQLGNLRSE